MHVFGLQPRLREWRPLNRLPRELLGEALRWLNVFENLSTEYCEPAHRLGTLKISWQNDFLQKSEYVFKSFWKTAGWSEFLQYAMAQLTVQTLAVSIYSGLVTLLIPSPMAQLRPWGWAHGFLNIYGKKYSNFGGEDGEEAQQMLIKYSEVHFRSNMK